MSTTKKPTHGMVREVHVTVNKAVFPSSTHFPENNLPFLKQTVDGKNLDMSIPATYWIEQYNESTDDWKPIYPTGQLRLKRRQQNGTISY